MAFNLLLSSDNVIDDGPLKRWSFWVPYILPFFPTFKKSSYFFSAAFPSHPDCYCLWNSNAVCSSVECFLFLCAAIALLSIAIDLSLFTGSSRVCRSANHHCRSYSVCVRFSQFHDGYSNKYRIPVWQNGNQFVATPSGTDGEDSDFEDENLLNEQFLSSA